MSLNKSYNLRQIAKKRCRELRRNSTPAEKIFWERVRNRKFLNLKINRQFPIFYDELGKETFYIADFYCHEKSLVIELDGQIHDKQKKQDKIRTEVLNEKGIKVIRFRNDEVEENIEGIIKKLKNILNSSLNPLSY